MTAAKVAGKDSSQNNYGKLTKLSQPGIKKYLTYASTQTNLKTN